MVEDLFLLWFRIIFGTIGFFGFFALCSAAFHTSNQGIFSIAVREIFFWGLCIAAIIMANLFLRAVTSSDIAQNLIHVYVSYPLGLWNLVVIALSISAITFAWHVGVNPTLAKLFEVDLT